MSNITEDPAEQAQTPFVFRGGELAIDLVNTEIMVRGKRTDLLTTPQDARAWWQEASHHYPPARRAQVQTENGADRTIYDETLLQALKTLRCTLRSIFQMFEQSRPLDEQDMRQFNEILKTSYLATEPGEHGNIHTTYRTTDERYGLILLPIALSALHLLQEGEHKRLHECASDRCIVFFYDTTRSATRRWCSLGCMDRARSIQRYQQAKQEKQRQS